MDWKIEYKYHLCMMHMYHYLCAAVEKTRPESKLKQIFTDKFRKHGLKNVDLLKKVVNK